MHNLLVVTLAVLVATAACAAPSRSVPAPIPMEDPSDLPAPDMPVLEDTEVAVELPADPARPAAADTQPVSIVDRIMNGFIAEAEHRRTTMATPARLKRIDAKLNEGRVNFLLFGYGETHEPPLTERAFIGSYTILSYDRVWREISLVSLTHDIRAPEIERFVRQSTAMKIDRAYTVGGFDLMREVIEDATGLAIDFTVALPDREIANLIDTVYGGVEINNPKTFTVLPFYLDGIKYPEGTFPQGVQKLDGKQVLQYIKTVPKEAPGRQDKALEHNVRKHRVVGGIVEATKANAVNPLFLGKLVQFLADQGKPGHIEMDFDAGSLIASQLPNGLSALTGLLGGVPAGLPSVNKTMYIHDPAAGDGGVRWVRGDPNPNTTRDIARGVYRDMNMAVPVNGNPNATDLSTGYWAYLRAHIKRLLLK